MAPPALCTRRRSSIDAGTPTRTLRSIKTTRSWPTTRGTASGMRSHLRISTAWLTGLQPRSRVRQARKRNGRNMTSPLRGIRCGGWRFGSDALWRTVVAIQGQTEGIALWVDVQAHHLQGIAHQSALDLFGAVILVGGDVQGDDPIA